VGHHRRSTRRGDADLGIPDGAERRGRTPRRRWRLLRLLVIVATSGLRGCLVGKGTLFAAAATTATPPTPAASTAPGLIARGIVAVRFARGDSLVTLGREVGVGRFALGARGGTRELLARENDELRLAALGNGRRWGGASAGAGRRLAGCAPGPAAAAARALARALGLLLGDL